jgi:hypothetical protein
VETRVPLTSDSVQRLRLSTQDQMLDLQARVAHVSQRQDVTAPENFLVGMQFLAVPQPVTEYIDGLVRVNIAEGAATPLPEGEA